MDKVAKKLGRAITATSKINFDAGNLAKIADGSCACNVGDTNVLVTVVADKVQASNDSFVPLSVDYRQKSAAAGRIPTTHLRRDIGTSESEILIGRLIDRSIRPGFIKGYCNETQVVCNLLSVDGQNDPDIAAINGASASLTLSPIPWNGPIGAVRVGLLGEKLICNPSRGEIKQSRMNLVVSANRYGNITMMDCSCREPVLMPDVFKAIRFGISNCRTIIEMILKLQKTFGKTKREYRFATAPSQEQLQYITGECEEEIKSILSNFELDKMARDAAIDAVRATSSEKFSQQFPGAENQIHQRAFTQVLKALFRKMVLDSNTRPDGRDIGDLRPIKCAINLYKPLHGSALFQRGQTQVFCAATFDSPDAAFRTDHLTHLISGVKEKDFMLHYEFPKFATNEVGRVNSLPGRREIGHGALAERALRPLVPENSDMTIRLNCEVLESNGSSSMASVCAGSLSLMDAGVGLREHVAGVAMGLVCEDEFLDDVGSQNNTEQMTEKSRVLTDILGFEDFMGDMDFKIAGTKRAITAFQLDVKPTNGLPPLILYQAIQKAHVAKHSIINIMEKAISKPREEKKDNHPVIKTIYIPPHQVPAFVGFGGSNLKKLTATIGVRISAYGNSDGSPDGTNQGNFIIFAPNQTAMAEAEDYIKSLTEKQKEPELEFNGIYTATIREIRPNGVLVTLYENMRPTLLPLSQLDTRVVSHPSALNLDVGNQIQVKYFGRDPVSGNMRISRKSLMMSSVPRTHQTSS